MGCLFGENGRGQMSNNWTFVCFLILSPHEFLPGLLSGQLPMTRVRFLSGKKNSVFIQNRYSRAGHLRPPGLPCVSLPGCRELKRLLCSMSELPIGALFLYIGLLCRVAGLPIVSSRARMGLPLRVTGFVVASSLLQIRRNSVRQMNVSGDVGPDRTDVVHISKLRIKTQLARKIVG